MGRTIWTLTFFNKIIPFLRPSSQTLSVGLLDIGALLDQRLQLAAQPVAVVDAARGALVVAGLPERVRRDREQRLLVAVVRHGGATLTHRPSVDKDRGFKYVMMVL